MQRWWISPPVGESFLVKGGEVIRGDALQTLNSLRSHSVDIVFLDPPFNLGKKYAGRGRKADELAEQEYLRYLRQGT